MPVSFPWLIPLLAAIATLVLAIVVNRSGRRTEASLAFTFLACMLTFWNLNFFILYSVSDHRLALDLTRVVRIGGLFAPPAILHLFLVIKKQRVAAWRYILGLDYALTCVIVALNALDLLVSDLRPFAWGYSSVGTPLYNLLTVSVLVNFLGTVGLLLHDYRISAEPRLHVQLKFWLLGVLIALPLALTNLLPAYGIQFYPLGNLGEAACMAVLAYAIVRHRLMDIDIVVTKGMAYAAVSFALIAPAFGIALWMQRVSFGHIHPDFSFAILVMLIAVGVFFPTIRLRAESRIEQSFFREKHEYRAALRNFTRSIVRILDRDQLVGDLTSTLSETLRLDRLVVALADDAKHTYIVHASTGIAPTRREFMADHPFITVLAARQQAALREELEAQADPALRSVIAATCHENGWEVCIPLCVGGKLTGFISLGRKHNLDTFSAGDLDLLETLGAEASVALENARLYGELKKSYEIIRRADRLSALGTLAAGIAHEIRNPLVSIQTFFQLAPERIHDEEFLTSFLGLTANEVRRISDLITELLSFARSPTPSLRYIDLNETVERVATLLEPEARKHKLTLERALDPTLPWINADADQMKQVLINLVLNAIQATPASGVIALATRGLLRGTAPFCQVAVRDTGAGIPRDQLDHIFNPFFTTKDKGTGLGLAIAHQIVVEHGGSVSVDSTEGSGTTFFIDLPAAPLAIMTESAATTPPQLLQYERPRKIAS